MHAETTATSPFVLDTIGEFESPPTDDLHPRPLMTGTRSNLPTGIMA
jgi:hypothetical protein